MIVSAIAILVILVVYAVTGMKVVRPWEKGLVERLGKYKRTVESGLNMIIPFIESVTKIDMREQVIEVPPQAVITKDNVVVEVDAVVYTEVTDPVKERYNVQNFYLATIKLAQTSLRNLIGDMSLDESLTSRDAINAKLRQTLDEATDKWGVRVTRVELQRIDPPQDVTASMHRQMKAERERRATVLEAEGQREAAIKSAEGKKQAAILEAEGRALAIRQVADAEKYQKIQIAAGESEAIINVYGAIHNGNPTNDLIAIKYLEALATISQGQATKIFLPFEASGVMSSIGGIAEMLNERLGGEPQNKT
jgi:regulator of protease activity HflC (stomatin/prohibitin superfamily)